MKEQRAYTPREVDSNINKLETQLDSLKSSRTELSQQINGVKKQIAYWNELDVSQIKLF